MVGIGKFVMRQKEYLAAVRSDGQHLTLNTLAFPDEMVDPATVEELEAGMRWLFRELYAKDETQQRLRSFVQASRKRVSN